MTRLPTSLAELRSRLARRWIADELAGAEVGNLFVHNNQGTFDRVRLARPPATFRVRVYDDAARAWVWVLLTMQEVDEP